VYHSFPQQCCRRAEAILRDSTGVPYYLRKIFNKKIKFKQESLVVENFFYRFSDVLSFSNCNISVPIKCRTDYARTSLTQHLCARFSVICEI